MTDTSSTSAEAIDELDVCMPTKDSADLLPECFDALEAALDRVPVSVGTIRIADAMSADDTVAVARSQAAERGWAVDVEEDESLTLPRARVRLIDEVRTPWFVFLDDDVRIEPDYLERLLAAIAPDVGGVQGRKASRGEHPTDWVRRRARRGGTHATVIRRDAVDDLSIPDDVVVLEDEYIRRHVEQSGYLWSFHHAARFRHDSQHRHPIGWTEGKVAGKYGLKPFHEVALNMLYAAVTGRSPVPHVARSVGWIAGRVDREVNE